MIGSASVQSSSILVLHQIRDLSLERIDQLAIDTAADSLFPNATPQTKNREFYTPVAAVLHRAGIERRIKRPVGWKGPKSTSWLEPPRAFRLFTEADAIDSEFGLLVQFLTYTGMRLGEALNARLRDLHLSECTLYVPDTKTGTPQTRVGAAIFSDDGELITQGCNEVPKAGGGTYWDLERPDHRDAKKGFDPNDYHKKRSCCVILSNGFANAAI